MYTQKFVFTAISPSNSVSKPIKSVRSFIYSIN